MHYLLCVKHLCKHRVESRTESVRLVLDDALLDSCLKKLSVSTSCCFELVYFAVHLRLLTGLKLLKQPRFSDISLIITRYASVVRSPIHVIILLIYLFIY